FTASGSGIAAEYTEKGGSRSSQSVAGSLSGSGAGRELAVRRHNISVSTDRVDVPRLPIVRLDLLTEAHHRVIDGPSHRRVGVAPDCAQQLVAIDDPVSPLRQVPQQLELERGQVQGRPTPGRTQCDEV